MELSNPFVISQYAGPDYFCDRKAETESLLSALYNGRNVTLISPRRMGKTGLIKNAFHLFGQNDKTIKTFYLDIFHTQCLSDFVNLFAKAVLGSLDSSIEKAMARVSKFIKSCRPSVSFDEMSSPVFSLNLEAHQEVSTLEQIFEYLKSADMRIFIAIDEFQQIAQYPEKGVEALLRSHIQFASNVQFIFAGSKQHMMTEMFFSAKRPFFQSTQSLSLGPIERNAYFEFCSAFFSKAGHCFPRDVFDALYDRLDGYTWYVHSVLNRLYSYRRDIVMADIDVAIDELIAMSVISYDMLQTVYTPTNMKVLTAIAKEHCASEVTGGAFLARYDFKASSTVASSVKTLMADELIYRTPQGYMVYDKFMEIWLSRL